MPSDGRGLALGVAALLGVALAAGCTSSAEPAAEPVPERFAGVRKQAAAPAPTPEAFCERSYPAGGPGARRYAAPPLRPLPGPDERARSGAGGWTWVNLWATWCSPCVEELELLRRWREALARDGVTVRLELVSVDAADREQELLAWRQKGLPGRLGWLRSEQDLAPLLDSLGVPPDAMIPVHALVDGAGWLRCVRTGAVHEQDYAAVKALVGR